MKINSAINSTKYVFYDIIDSNIYQTKQIEEGGSGAWTATSAGVLQGVGQAENERENDWDLTLRKLANQKVLVTRAFWS